MASFATENVSQDLSWLCDSTLDFENNDTHVNTDLFGDGHNEQSTVSVSPKIHNEVQTHCVNPADLYRVSHSVSRNPNPPTSSPVADEVTMLGTSSTGNAIISAMDEFFRLQGGWRPPVPCTHCKRLRLQCFMLQTALANPNPVKSCSSCVALYRHCSLAGPAKRQASTFETPKPVIGQLHGVYEDERVNHIGGKNDEAKVMADSTARVSKRSSSRSNTSTRPLRLWFNDHLEHPYPSEREKELLGSVSGLSRAQIDNWFGNARRRKRQSEQATSAAGVEIHRQGSPMPQISTANMTPLERWKQSPPDAEPAQFGDIERAIGLVSRTSSFDTLEEASHNAHGTLSFPDPDLDGARRSLPASVDSSSNATSSCNSLLSYTSSKRSHSDNNLEVLPSKRHQRSRQPEIQCAACARTFTRRSDLLRHERAIHSLSKETWICSNLILPGESATVWRISQPGPECALCGCSNPDEKHMLSHEFVACADRHIAERTFTRKDHLFQHLEKFHRCRRKWDGWDLDGAIERLRHVQVPLGYVHNDKS
jgi:hypothetical protein